MIRLKSKMVDLKRSYPRDLGISVGLAALVFVIDPKIAIEAIKSIRKPLVIQL
tara:strand:+ start:301 stop:459 length:159 start_codon:yes stop_codon:yes gene_type:complete